MSHSTMQGKGRIRAVIGGSAGNLVEWYDWFAYTSFTLYFAPHFFPEGDQTSQLLQAAAVLAIGFVARPVGAWAMGLYADRAGRRAALVLAVSMMSAGSFAIALLPGYDRIGMLAPAGLLLARLVQGLSVGGEYGASATYLAEVAGQKRRGLWSSFHFVTLIAGQLLALGTLVLLQAIMPEPALAAWGWRLPFALGGALAIIVFWLRRGIEESSAFAKTAAADRRRSSALTIVREHPREAGIAFVLTASGSLAFYTYTSYMQKFLVNSAGFPKDVATTAAALALLAYLPFHPVAGWLSDRIGRRPMMTFTFGGIALGTYPLMTSIAEAPGILSAGVLMVALLLILSGYAATSAVFKAELFPAHIRTLGVALPYAVANAIFGGSAEYIALWCRQAGIENAFFLYVSALGLVGLVVVRRMRDPALRGMIEDD